MFYSSHINMSGAITRESTGYLLVAPVYRCRLTRVRIPTNLKGVSLYWYTVAYECSNIHSLHVFPENQLATNRMLSKFVKPYDDTMTEKPFPCYWRTLYIFHDILPHVSYTRVALWGTGIYGDFSAQRHEMETSSVSLALCVATNWKFRHI